MLLLTILSPAAGVAIAASESDGANSQGSLEHRVAHLSDKVGDVSSELESAEKAFNLISFPVTVLVSILAAGGLLGIVYSFRDQRRASQLHDLTVGGEIASQKRSEQSYASFLDQSQTTLSLVNDTLGLAKQAHDRAMQSMENKAQSRVDEIEERSQTLLLDVFAQEEFELIINDDHRRHELHDIASDLRSLEGYLSLQDIPLREYTKFVKALDQFLLDDTDAAIHALRLASQEGTVGELQRFIQYWLGYMLTTVGDYEEAIRKFEHDEVEMDKDHPEFFQLERIIDETKFFQIAKQNAQKEAPPRGGRVVTPPASRFELVAGLLDQLAELAEHLEESEHQHAKHHTRLEIARTRADIYEWVAYDSDHLDDPLEAEEIARATTALGGETAARKIVKAGGFAASPAWKSLCDADAVRAWALMQALSVCGSVEKRNLDLEFARAECLFKLGQREDADRAFESAEHALHHEFEELHEKRRSASIHQSVLICHSRLLKLREDDPAEQRELRRRIIDAARETVDVVKDMRQRRVTVFSQIQRRNISQTEFREEVQEIVRQDGIKEKVG
jgi:tetratricopeptide (TPR) repeat protein